MNNHKLKFHFGEQNTEEWKALKIGKFSSSTAYQLFENPSKQSRSKAAMKQMKNGGWGYIQETLENQPDNNQMNYAIGYLLDFGFGKKPDFVEAKKTIKDAFKSSDFMYIDKSDFYGFGVPEKLILRACYAIENIDILAGSAVGLARTKALEVIHNELKDDLSNIKAIEWGNENEPLASQFFERKTGHFVDSGDNRVAFVEIVGTESGSSPDDLIFSKIPSEYKCPHNKKIHFDHTQIRSGNDLFLYDKQKYIQLQHQIFAMKSDFGFWSSFDPRLLNQPRFKHKALWTLKIKANPKYMKLFESKTKKAVEIRDEFIRDFEETNDRLLWDY